MTKGMLDSSKSPLIPPVRTSGTIAFRERGGWQIEGVVVIFKAPFSNSPTGGKGLTVGSAPPSLSKKGDTEGFFVIWLDTDLRRNGEEEYRQGRLYNYITGFRVEVGKGEERWVTHIIHYCCAPSLQTLSHDTF